MVTKLESLHEQIKKLQTQAKEEAKRLFHDGIKQLFTDYPVINAIQWRQYTPSFNDGDPCVFRSNHEYADIKWTGEEDFTDEGFGDTPEQEKAANAVSTFLSQFTDNDMESTFGNGYEVTVTKDGVEIEDYYD